MNFTKLVDKKEELRKENISKIKDEKKQMEK